MSAACLCKTVLVYCQDVAMRSWMVARWLRIGLMQKRSPSSVCDILVWKYGSGPCFSVSLWDFLAYFVAHKVKIMRKAARFTKAIISSTTKVYKVSQVLIVTLDLVKSTVYTIQLLAIAVCISSAVQLQMASI